ncbi:UDP-N-acetylmuramoylalanyl-D-glutamyl-2,6-diaminopimelate--D-alanyl-D-alanine ligase [Notoacmeibacter ruber]|uniref:UDP-N-acetylmuramoyl-tripeptide--D-alanyl-D-alanine ligase n=1 Tax=Notoacmeibacter ruber TaxID=2670375 RepID=A0A3L7JC22_9HYPH|nr:UDP-N-acetylmuramoylalanyl-D-glutamyl-2,6-diaminopimelate--D-alanyl-D-alanine ligase [Notoacmeibacter ruber]RLQ88186.1 UDP-N-acetylmuramoylalanyl-D-glutamyl-2,6-diaminopimelate--D-alanyl-D-alanine ligase [Notoacmeibacter ruber]
MSWLWTTEDMISAMDGRPVGVMPEGITGISIDSRTISQGEAFFAIKGDRFDGHDFCTKAIANGASLLVVSEAKLPAMGRLRTPMIVVRDVLESLSRLGEAARARSRARIIAVTGSVGKTTTKEILRTALETSGAVHASDKSFNNHWGVPLTLARMPENTQFGIFEIGMNHPGEIRPLVKIVRPHIAIITIVAPAHIGHFSSIEEIARAKAEIFERVVRGGTAVLNRDDDHFEFLEELARKAGVDHVLGFGEHPRSAFQLRDYKATREGALLSISLSDDLMELKMGVRGRHMAHNALAALGAAKLTGADVGKAAIALASLQAGAGRGETHTITLTGGGGATLIDESYNANPASMAATLDELGQMTPGEGGRRIAILGEMRELGERSADYHAALVGPIEAAGVDVVLTIGDDMQALQEALPEGVEGRHCDDLDELARQTRETLREGDIALVKGSNGLGLSRLVAVLRGTEAKR